MANAPEVQLLSDGGLTSVVKISGIYTSGVTANTKVVTANALSFANNSQPCLITISKIQYVSDVSGFVQLEWQGSPNAAIASFGSGQSGELNAYFPNYANTATGDINLFVSGAASGDSFTLIVTLNKEQGFANAFVEYNDASFKP